MANLNMTVRTETRRRRPLDNPLFCILVFIDLVEEVGILIAEDNLGRVNPPGAVLKLHNAEYLTEHLYDAGYRKGGSQ